MEKSSRVFGSAARLKKGGVIFIYKNFSNWAASEVPLLSFAIPSLLLCCFSLDPKDLSRSQNNHRIAIILLSEARILSLSEAILRIRKDPNFLEEGYSAFGSKLASDKIIKMSKVRVQLRSEGRAAYFAPPPPRNTPLGGILGGLERIPLPIPSHSLPISWIIRIVIRC